MKANTLQNTKLVAAGFTLATIAMLLLPEMAYAVSYDTIVSLLRDCAHMIFIDAGPYIFMIAFGITLVGVGKGWIPMKAGVILIAVCFCFFAVPAGVRYLEKQAETQI